MVYFYINLIYIWISNKWFNRAFDEVVVHSTADLEVCGSNPTLTLRERNESPLDQGVNWFPERAVSVCKFDIPGRRMLAAQKSGVN